MPYTPSAAVEAASQATYDLKRAFELFSATMARLEFEFRVQRVTGELPPPKPRQTSAGRRAGTVPRSYPCYREVAGSLVADTLTPLTGQTFDPVATPWEREWSRLCEGGGGFTPVVTQPGALAGAGLATVAGHVGTVPWGSLIENDAGERYVHGGKPPAGWRTHKKANTADSFYQVFTLVDGQVVNARFSHSREGDMKPAFDPVDLIADVIAGRLLVRLSRGGSVHLSSVYARKVDGRPARTALLGPVATAAKAATRAADEAVVYATYNRAAMGIPKKHFDAMAAAAKETDSVAVFRANKGAAVGLIENGAVGRPKALSMRGFKTDPKTGVLTASTPEQFALVGRTPDYYLVNGKGEVGRTVTRDGKQVYETITPKGYWTLEFGQVVHKSGHPVVGDYDLLGVMPVKSPGSAAVGVPADGLKGDWLGPHVDKYMKALNPKLDKPRVLHGAQDQFHGPGGGFDDGAAYAVFPDGRVVIMNGRAEQEAFYKAMKRQTPGGSYNPGGRGVPAGTEDIGPGGRRKKK